MQTIKLSQLSKPRQILIRLCQRINYGSILNVQVLDGDIYFELSPDIVVDFKLDGDAAPRHELDLDDFALPAETCRLLAAIDFLKDGMIEKIVIYDGIPRRVLLRGTAAEVRI